MQPWGGGDETHFQPVPFPITSSKGGDEREKRERETFLCDHCLFTLLGTKAPLKGRIKRQRIADTKLLRWTLLVPASPPWLTSLPFLRHSISSLCLTNPVIRTQVESRPADPLTFLYSGAGNKHGQSQHRKEREEKVMGGVNVSLLQIKTAARFFSGNQA